MLVGHAGAWLLAIALMARLRTGSKALDVVGAFVLNALIVTILVLLLGSVKLINVWGLAGAGLAVGAIGLAMGGARILREGAIAARDAARSAKAESPFLFWTAMTLLLLVVVRGLFNTWYYGPTVLDSAQYHLPRLGAWIQTGGLHRPDLLDLRGFFPAGMQVLQAWWVGFLHHDVIIEGASLQLVATGAVACAALARRMGTTTGQALLAGALFAACPAALLQGASELNDAALAGLVIAAFALAFRPAETASSLALATAAAGIGAGIKPTMLFAAPGIVLIAVVSAVAVRPKLRAPHGVVALLALFAGAYWYLINYGEFGNPIYPIEIGTGISAKVGVIEAQIATKPDPGRLIKNVLDYFGPFLANLGGNHSPVLPATTGWGWALTLLGLPGAALLALRSSERRREWWLLAGGMLLSIVTTLALSEDDAWKGRFCIYFAGLLSVALVAAATSLRVPAILGFLALVGSVANIGQSFVPPVPYVKGNRWAALRAVTQQPLMDRSAGTLLLAPLSDHERDFIRRHPGPMMTATMGFPVYALLGPDFSRRVEFIVTDDPATLVARMRDLKCDILFVMNTPPAMSQAVARAVEQGLLIPAGPGLVGQDIGWFTLRKQ